jgi:hypothetical protein
LKCGSVHPVSNLSTHTVLVVDRSTFRRNPPSP